MSSQLGWKISGVISTPSTTVISSNGTTLTISQIDLPIGIWLLVGTYVPNITSAPSVITSCTINLATLVNTVQYTIGWTTQQSPPAGSTISTTGIYNATAAVTMYLNISMQYTGGSITRGDGVYYFLYTATRIG